MSLPPVLLLIDLDPETTRTFEAAAQEEHHARLLVARTWLQAQALVHNEHPDLVIASPELPEGAAPLCRGIAEAAGESAPLLALLVDKAFEIDSSWPETPAPLALARPVPASAARSLIRHAAERRALNDALRDARVEARRFEARARHGDQDTVEMLLRMLEMRHPGAVTRAERRRVLAADLAERLGIPNELRRDLEIAARLQELGRMLSGGTDSWRAAQCTRTLLASLDGFGGAAEIMEASCEHWDGTGSPGHLMQGQIPLRARILRVLHDYVGSLEAPGADETAVLERVAARSGTWYDPMVVVHLRAIAAERSSDATAGSHTILPVEELAVGMVLAEDLYTDSGIKLLARGTEITPSTLGTILRRHRVEPLLHGARVVRRSA